MLDVLEIDFKKHRIIINDRGIKRKYAIQEIASDCRSSLYRCRLYRFFNPLGTTESSFQAMHDSFSWIKYRQFKDCSFPFPMVIDYRKKKFPITEMCVTVFFENGKISQILDHHDTVDYFDALKVGNILQGNCF